MVVHQVVVSALLTLIGSSWADRPGEARGGGADGRTPDDSKGCKGRR